MINQIIDEDIMYWEKATIPYSCHEEDAEELKITVEKLVVCKCYVTVVKLLDI